MGLNARAAQPGRARQPEAAAKTALPGGARQPEAVAKSAPRIPTLAAVARLLARTVPPESSSAQLLLLSTITRRVTASVAMPGRARQPEAAVETK